MEGIGKLELATESPGAEIDVDHILREYRKLYPKPIWRLVEDIERQGMLYSNIIEQIKSGQEAPEGKLPLRISNFIVSRASREGRPATREQRPVRRKPLEGGPATSSKSGDGA